VSRGVCRGCSQSISRSKAGRAQGIVSAFTNMAKLFAGQLQRPDLEAIVASGLFEECAGAVAAVGAAGTEGLHDTHHTTLYVALTLLKNCRQQPGCEARIRSLAPSLAFCLENDLDLFEQLGTTTASNAAQICESIYSECELRSVLIHSMHVPRRLRRVWARRRRLGILLHAAARRYALGEVVANRASRRLECHIETHR
jgi:hypothetical protein